MWSTLSRAARRIAGICEVSFRSDFTSVQKLGSDVWNVWTAKPCPIPDHTLDQLIAMFHLFPVNPDIRFTSLILFHYFLQINSWNGANNTDPSFARNRWINGKEKTQMPQQFTEADIFLYRDNSTHLIRWVLTRAATKTEQIMREQGKYSFFSSRFSASYPFFFVGFASMSSSG